MIDIVVINVLYYLQVINLNKLIKNKKGKHSYLQKKKKPFDSRSHETTIQKIIQKYTLVKFCI